MRKINFTQFRYYCTYCEKCFRQNFLKKFERIFYNLKLSERISEQEDQKAIVIDPNYISKSGKCILIGGPFWSNCTGQIKYSLEIIGIGLIDIDKHGCITLKAKQLPDNITFKRFLSCLALSPIKF